MNAINMLKSKLGKMVDNDYFTFSRVVKQGFCNIEDLDRCVLIDSDIAKGMLSSYLDSVELVYTTNDMKTCCGVIYYTSDSVLEFVSWSTNMIEDLKDHVTVLQNPTKGLAVEDHLHYSGSRLDSLDVDLLIDRHVPLSVIQDIKRAEPIFYKDMRIFREAKMLRDAYFVISDGNVRAIAIPDTTAHFVDLAKALMDSFDDSDPSRLRSPSCVSGIFLYYEVK